MEKDERFLAEMAKRLRRHSLQTTAIAKSGHPTTCLSCADLVATLFFRYLRYDLSDPNDRRNDRFILSKGHAAPVLWAALAEAGAFPREHLGTLRRIDSELEGHPTPRSPFVDVASGSLGQGLSVGAGMALSSKMDGLKNRIYVLMGDGELAEGSIWEAASFAGYRSLDNLVGIFDINALGQSQRTMFGHDVELYSRRLAAFGWETRTIDGHDLGEIRGAFDWAVSESEAPRAIVAKTFKGHGVSFLADLDDWHGKPVMGDDLDRALAELGPPEELAQAPRMAVPDQPPSSRTSANLEAMDPPEYGPDDTVATRKAYGNGLRKLGRVHSEVVVLDGDTKNSTYSQDFLAEFPERFVECFIAEQNMVGVATGFSALGKVPFSSTFAAFLTRAYDQIRMGAVSRANLKICGSHAGASIGEDGPSQMGLEDIAMMRAIAGSTVLYPSDGVSAERIVRLAAETEGIVYIRTTRPQTPILYGKDEEFKVGGCKVWGAGPENRATVVAGGITLHEALAAQRQLAAEGISIRVIDLYSVKPVDEATLRVAARETGHIVTVEDHYAEGGLGEAVLAALAEEPCRVRKLAVNGLPRSGGSAELMEIFGVDRNAILSAVTSSIEAHETV